MCDSTVCGCWQEGLTDAARAWERLTVQRVGPVSPGTVVVVRCAVSLGADGEFTNVLATELANASGHHQFVVVHLADPDTSLDVVHDPEAMADLLGLQRLGTAELLPEPERVQSVRRWRDQVADRYSAEPRQPASSDLEANNRAWWQDVNALLHYVDQLQHPLPDVVVDITPDLSAWPNQRQPHPALLVGDSTACPCGEPTTSPVHQGQLHVPAELASSVPDLVQRLDASLAAAQDYLATHPAEPERTYLDVLADQDDGADDPWRGTPGLSDAD